MLKLMWQKGYKHGLVGEGEGKKTSSASSWAWWHFAHLVTFRWWQQKRWPGLLKLYGYFQLLITNAEDVGGKKKSSAHVFSMRGEGPCYPYPRILTKGQCQEDGFKPIKKSIKNTPQGTEKGLFRDKTVVHKYKEGSWDISTHTRYIYMYVYSNMRQTCSHCHYTALSTHASIFPLSTPE